jgi:hypothetical protein
MEFVFLDCLRNPAFDSVFAAQRFSFVTDDGIV